MTLYSRDAAERLLAIATKATNIVETDSAHLAQLAETIIALYDRAAPPRIIRTREELDALDPDTLLFSIFDTVAFPAEEAQKSMARGRWTGIGWIPAVVIIATGDHVRAARQALEEA